MLRNKVVVISGASSGIGRATAVSCLQHGAKLVLNHIGTPESEQAIRLLCEELNQSADVVEIGGDISDSKVSQRIVDLAVKAFGRVDVLVSNAGICEFTPFFDVTPSKLERHTSINYHGSYFLVQAAALQMSRQIPQGGSIISVSSISALVGGGEQTHYTPTKAALLNLMQSCAVSLGKYGIRCNAVLPGTIQTDMNREDLKDSAKREYMASRCALGRLGVPEDLAGPIVFLASDMSAYMSGSQLLVDGGLFANLQ